jgi:hypothetical protein
LQLVSHALQTCAIIASLKSLRTLAPIRIGIVEPTVNVLCQWITLSPGYCPCMQNLTLEQEVGNVKPSLLSAEPHQASPTLVYQWSYYPELSAFRT